MSDQITDAMVEAATAEYRRTNAELADVHETKEQIMRRVLTAALAVAGDQTCGVCKGTGKTRDGQWCLICDVSALPAPPAPKEG